MVKDRPNLLKGVNMVRLGVRGYPKMTNMKNAGYSMGLVDTSPIGIKFWMAFLTSYDLFDNDNLAVLVVRTATTLKMARFSY